MKFIELLLCLLLLFLNGGGNNNISFVSAEDEDGDGQDGDISSSDGEDGIVNDGDDGETTTLSPAPTAATTTSTTTNNDGDDTPPPPPPANDEEDNNDDPTPSPVDEGGSIDDDYDYNSSGDDDGGGGGGSGTDEIPSDLPPITKFNAIKDDPKTLNIHIVPHTHDDVGWLKTVDQYYFGWNQTIQIANVKSILDTLMIALKDKDYRTFSYAEQRFFSMWWFDHDTTADVQNLVIQQLLPNHQLIFVNGGWSMHDEACTHYMGMIDQMTTGHSFLKQEFNFIPTIGWQLDPFGHSQTQATLMTSKLGFDAMYLGRISHDELAHRKSTKETEGLWTGSSSNAGSGGDISTIFWGLTGSYHGNYGPPHGYRFDEGSGNPNSESPLLQNMTREEQVANIASGLLPQIATQASETNGNHIMLTMGSDFRYQNAPVIFESLDIMIQISNMIGSTNYNNTIDKLFKDLGYDKIHMFYSNPEYYTQKKYDALSEVTYSPAKTDDFFPYADLHDGTSAYWTGYYTSRTGFKRMERVASSYLMAARQIEATSGLYVDARHMPPPNSHHNSKQNQCDCGASTFSLEDALGIAQHHDAITGTAKQHVAFDYAQRLQHGIFETTGMVLFKLRGLILEHTQLNRKEALSDLRYCQLLNETKCKLSVDTTTDSDDVNDLYVIVYNSLAHPRSSVIRLPVGREDVFTIQKVLEKTDADDPSAPNMTPPKYVQSVSSNKDTSNVDEGAGYVIYFDTGDLPPLGSSVYRIGNNNNRRRKMQDHYDDDPTPSPLDDNDGDGVSAPTPSPSPDSDASDNTSTEDPSSESSTSTDPPTAIPAAPVNTVTLSDVTDEGHIIASNGKLNVHFDSSTGEIIEVGKDGEDAFSMKVSQTWGYYKSYDEPNQQRSGAYIFRPSEPDEEPIVANPTTATFVEAGDAIEVHVDHDLDWIHQVFRLGANQEYVEMEYTIGPIPISDGIGKEIVTRYKTDIGNDKICYTDANGREFQKRTYNPNAAEPVAGNYYPVNTAIYAEDDLSSLSIVTDRTQGGACLSDGTIELMVQRRILADDTRGVHEPLNETTLGVTPYPPYGDATRQGTGIVIRGKHRLLIGLGNHGASLARSAMDGAFAEPLVFVGTSPSNSPDPGFRSGTAGASAAGISAALPDNVMLLTFSRLDTFLFLVRIGHQYGHGEEPVLSKPKIVDMESLFDGYKIKDMIEMTLSANQKYKDWADRRMDWAGEGRLPPGIDDGPGANTLIRLRPMDIRTFIIEIEPSHGAHSPGTHNKDIKKKNADDNVVTTVVPAVVLAFLLIVIGLIVYASRHQRYREFENVVAAAEKDCNYKYDLELSPYAPPIS